MSWWLWADSTIRFFVLRILFSSASLRTLIGAIHFIPIFRYRGLSAIQREWVFSHLQKLSKRFARRAPMVQALVLYWMDSRSNLAIGISRSDESFSGHAWVESEQQILSTIETTAYSRLVRYGARGELIL